MDYNDFNNYVLNHLEKYKRDVLRIEKKGVYKYKGEVIRKGHILPLDSSLSAIEAKKQVVKEFNQLNCIKEQPFLIEGNLHRYAHHLNSSQLMCYNFFRPYIKEKGGIYSPTQDLVNLLCLHNIKFCLSDNAKCQFEYVNQESEWTDENTNFDFYIESGGKRIYFEIKYTEKSFGNCKNDKYHKDKFEGKYKDFKDGYKEKIKNCPAIKEEKRNIEFNGDFCKNYQLLRNVIRVTTPEIFSVFVFDERNDNISTHFESFMNNYISEDYKNNVIAITWQELVENLKSCHREQFCEKYLN